MNTHDAKMTRAARLDKWFNRVIVAAILASTYITLWNLFGESELMEAVDVAILRFFVLEVGVRLIGRIRKTGWHFWRDGWLMFDAVIIGLSLLPLGENLIALRIMRASRLVHVGRHITHLRHLTVFRWVSQLARK